MISSLSSLQLPDLLFRDLFFQEPGISVAWKWRTTSNRMALNGRVSKKPSRGGKARRVPLSKSNPPGNNGQETGKYHVYLFHSIPNKPLTRFIVFDTEDTFELLASKSNYQCIIEGESSIAGLSFLDSIVESIDRKRTSHTAAERTRRSDMKIALNELSSVISQDCCDEVSRKAHSAGTTAYGSGGNSGKAQSGSKVCTVELAIEYIKCLQKEVAGSKGRPQEGYVQQGHLQ